MQTVAKQAFTEALPGLGRWDPVVVLGLLRDDLHRSCGFTGILNSVEDLDRLTDEQVKAFCQILPGVISDLPSLD